MKNITALILIIALLVGSCFSLTALGEEPISQPPKKVADAVNLFSAIEIIKGDEKGDFGLDKIVTRAEFAAMAYRMLGFEKRNIAVGEALSIADMPTDYWAEKPVRTLISMGYIEQYADGTVRADEPIELSRIVYILVHALGYDVHAEAKGGYPNGYMTVATNLGLFKDISGLSDKDIKRSDALLLMKKAFKTDIMVQQSFGVNVEYSISDGRTLMEDALDIVQRNGVVTANDTTTLTGESTLNENEIAIDEITFKVGKLKVTGLFGNRVDYYYTYDEYNQNRTLVYIENAANNKVLELNADEILSSTTKNVIKYTRTEDKETSKESTANMKSDAYVIYNNMAYGALQAMYIIDSDFRPVSGKVTLVDNNGDGAYEVATITSYDIFVVESVTENSISDKINPNRSKVLDKEDKTIKLTINKNGKDVKTNSLEEWDVVAIAQSKSSIGKTVISATVVGTKIQGFIEEVSGDKITVAGKSYEVSPIYPSENSKYNLKIGSGGTLYFDTNGRIVIGNINNTMSLKYGFLFDAQPGKTFSKEAEFKILDTENKWTILKSTEKIKSNGETTIMANDLANTVKNKKQLIMYAVNDLNQLTELYTAVDMTKVAEGAPPYKGYTDDSFSLDFVSSKSTRAYDSIIGIKYLVSSTIAFVGPNFSDSTANEERNFGFQSVPIDSNMDYFELYDNTKYNTPALLRYYGSPSATISLSYMTSSIILDSFSDAYDAKTGETRKKAYFMQAGKKVGYNLKDNDVKDSTGYLGYSGTKLVDLKPGSMMQISLNVDKEIESIIIFASIDTLPGPFRKTPPLIADKYWEMFGSSVANEEITNVVNRYSLKSVVVERNGSVMVVNAHSDGTNHQWDRTFSIIGKEFYLYDRKTSKITSVQPQDIYIGDEIYIHCAWNLIRVAMIVRN